LTKVLAYVHAQTHIETHDNIWYRLFTMLREQMTAIQKSKITFVYEMQTKSRHFVK